MPWGLKRVWRVSFLRPGQAGIREMTAGSKTDRGLFLDLNLSGDWYDVRQVLRQLSIVPRALDFFICIFSR